MNSWHSWSPNGRWLVFASKAGGPFTQLWLTHIDADGNDTPPVLLEHFTAADRAANIPEFVNIRPEQFAEIRQEFADYYTHYRAGTFHEHRHQYAQAIEEFQKALTEEPNHVESLYLLASCLARIDREEEAIPYARKAAALMPNSTTIARLAGSAAQPHRPVRRGPDAPRGRLRGKPWGRVHCQQSGVGAGDLP